MFKGFSTLSKSCLIHHETPVMCNIWDTSDSIMIVKKLNKVCIHPTKIIHIDSLVNFQHAQQTLYSYKLSAQVLQIYRQCNIYISPRISPHGF